MKETNNFETEKAEPLPAKFDESHIETEKQSQWLRKLMKAKVNQETRGRRAA